MHTSSPAPGSLSVALLFCSCSPLAQITATDGSDGTISTAEATIPTSTGQVTLASESATMVSMCSDGHLDPGEQCDVGNLAPNDVCRTDCTFTPQCGNGKLEAGEDCDDGNQRDDDACPIMCKDAFCGDGHVQAGKEECDDGNPFDNDDCLNTCTIAVCGDGSIHFGIELCDDGNQLDADACLITCKPASCGDGHVQVGVEECEDGNQIDTDACLSTCKKATCGDGHVQAGVEECDDGIRNGGDFCSVFCVTTARIVFVTTATFNGNLGGLTGADDKCTSAAESTGIGRPGAKWRAWLSDDSGSPALRMDHNFYGYYQRPDGALVATGWFDLADAILSSPISITEKGNALPPSSLAWTNTSSEGEMQDSRHCSKWSSSSVFSEGRHGAANSKDSLWTQAGLTNCSEPIHIYCIEN